MALCHIHEKELVMKAKKVIKFANLKHSYNELPCGYRLFTDGKLYEGTTMLYRGYSSLKCNDGSFIGYFPASVLQFFGSTTR